MAKKKKNVLAVYWCIMEMQPNGTSTRHEVGFEKESEAQEVAENLPPGIYYLQKYTEVVPAGQKCSVPFVTTFSRVVDDNKGEGGAGNEGNEGGEGNEGNEGGED